MGKKVIGILGGMGPLATYDLAGKIIKHTAAERDQDHVHVIVDCNTDIPDRTEAILRELGLSEKDLGEAPSPKKELIKSAKFLEDSGCDLIIIPCNTAHYYYDDIKDAVGIKILHMPRLTAEEAKNRGVRKAGILATDGTIKTGVYEMALNAMGVEPVIPSPEAQRILMDLIYGHVKAGNMDFSDLDIEYLLKDMEDAGAAALLMACTELPMAFDIISSENYEYMGKNLIDVLLDPTDILAINAIREAGYPVK